MEPQMKRIAIPCAIALLAAVTIPMKAGAANIDQSGDYTLTVVRDNGWQSHTMTRQLNASQMERLSARVPERMARFPARPGHRWSWGARGRKSARPPHSGDTRPRPNLR